MKSISTTAVIEGVRSRKDGSLGLTISTPELTPQEKALFMELQGVNLKLVMTPLDEKVTAEEYKVEADINQKSQSERIRGSLYVLLEKKLNRKPTRDEWQSYYQQQTESYIERIKEKIAEYGQ